MEKREEETGGGNGEGRRRNGGNKKEYKIHRLSYSTFQNSIASLITGFIMSLVCYGCT
jgi:hypothetical protein